MGRGDVCLLTDGGGQTRSWREAPFFDKLTVPPRDTKTGQDIRPGRIERPTLQIYRLMVTVLISE